MSKVVRMLIAMMVGGIVSALVSMYVLMDLGARYHGNYEYYGRQYGVLTWAPVVFGFLAPGVVVWYLDRRG